jgi:hypothetical protein
MPYSAYETWKGNNNAAVSGGGSTWVTGTYDPDTDTIVWVVGAGDPGRAAAADGRVVVTLPGLVARLALARDGATRARPSRAHR